MVKKGREGRASSQEREGKSQRGKKGRKLTFRKRKKEEKGLFS